jgi:PAS domain S-box-containing protein
LSQDALLLKDQLRLDAIVNDANKDEDVLYTIVRDAGGAILTTRYASINFRSPLVQAILQSQPLDAELPAILRALGEQLAVTELSMPIMVDVRTVGTVTIGMSRDRIRREVVKTVLFVVALNVTVALLLGALLFISSKKILLTPIEELAQAALRLARGDLSTKVSVNATGEVGMLVESFNDMARNLERTTVSRDYMDNVINSMIDTLIVASPEGIIVRANHAACVLSGYREEELLGLALDQLVFSANGVQGLRLEHVLAERALVPGERTFRARDGRSIPVLFSASVMRDLSGAVQGIVCAAQDLTDRKRDEAQLQAYSDELAEINEELKNFAYIVSHDLRAPLLNIRGFSQELTRSIQTIEPCFQKHLPYLDPEDRDRVAPLLQKEIPEALHFISSSVVRMDGLINAILRLSRAGRRKVHPERVRVRELVQETVESQAHQIASANATVTLRDLPEVVADRAALVQIFSNLLDNAIKYLEPGRPGTIEVSAERSDGAVLFHIRDNGRGIAREDIARAFEMFRRVGRQDVPGEGIGLPHVKALVRLLGGRIWCESETGKGSTFSFSLPLAVTNDR